MSKEARDAAEKYANTPWTGLDRCPPMDVAIEAAFLAGREWTRANEVSELIACIEEMNVELKKFMACKKAGYEYSGQFADDKIARSKELLTKWKGGGGK